MVGGGFDSLGYDSVGYDVFVKPDVITTSDNSYWRYWRPKIEIYNNTGDTLLLTYDAFDPESELIKCTECEVQLGLTQSTFTLRFEDGSHAIDITQIGLGNKVKIYTGQTSADQLLFTGYTEKRSPRILGDGVMDYLLYGFGETAALNDLIVNFKRASTSLNLTDPNIPTRPDSKMQVHELVRDLFEDLDVRILKDQSIKDYLGLDLSGISPEVQERLLSIAETTQEASRVLDFLAEVTGANYKIENGRLIFEYPLITHSGIVIKNQKAITDNANTTSYFIGPWEFEDSIAKEDGFANRIYTFTSIETKAVTSGLFNRNASVLYNRAIAQQFIAIDTRFSDIAVILSRIGDPFPSTGSTEVLDQAVDAEIRIDNNGKPDGPTISSFKIPVSGLSSAADTIFVNGIKVSSAVSSPNTKYWLVLFPVGESNGDTIRWHHDNDISVPNRFSAFAIGENKNSPFTWHVSDFGPIYTHSIFSRIRRLQEYSDPQSIKTFRLKEDVVDISFLDDTYSVAKMMQNILSFRAKPVRKYSLNEVTIPSNRLFLPGQYVTIYDSTGHHDISRNVLAEVQEAKYRWTTDDPNNTLGTFRCDILPIGHVNWHQDLFPIET